MSNDQPKLHHNIKLPRSKVESTNCRNCTEIVQCRTAFSECMGKCVITAKLLGCPKHGRIPTTLISTTDIIMCIHQKCSPITPKTLANSTASHSKSRAGGLKLQGETSWNRRDVAGPSSRLPPPKNPWNKLVIWIHLCWMMPCSSLL